jgi:hypothetical protein
MLSPTEKLRQEVFYICAKRFDFVLPEVVYSSNYYYVLRTGDLDIEFIYLSPNPESQEHCHFEGCDDDM